MDKLYTVGFREVSGLSSFNNFLKSDHWLQRYCILSGGVFYFEPPGICVCGVDGNTGNNIVMLNQVVRESDSCSHQ